MPLHVGDKAPDFSTWSTGGEKVGDKLTLSEVYRNHRAVVLAFFPLAFTGG